MTLMSVLLAAGTMATVSQAAALENAMPVRVTGAWTVEVGPGSVTQDGNALSLDKAVSVAIPKPATISVRDEGHANVRVFNPSTSGWRKGPRLNAVITQECSATGLVDVASVRVKPAKGDAGTVYQRGEDWDMDDSWGTFGRIEGGAISAEQKVYVDYDYTPCRLDSVAIDAAGNVRLVVGEPGVGIILPPELEEGETALCNVWLGGPTARLTEDNLFPIEFVAPPVTPTGESQAERFLPRTLAKLQAGKQVTIVAWGDSVTNGGGVGPKAKDLWYQHQFAARLQERFPKAQITMLTAAWPGGNSTGYLKAPPEHEHNFKRDVIDPKPDLVTIEFVNDAGLNEERVQEHYAHIIELLEGNGSEVALITPHFVRPDWMKVSTQKVDEDPRAYVKGLRRFSKENDVALADASKGWCRLWRQGIPYMTLEGNSINHPDERGHRIFADALMGLFPVE